MANLEQETPFDDTDAATPLFSAFRLQQRADLADDAAAEEQDADDEDHAGDHRHGQLGSGQIVLERHHQEGANDGAEDGP